MFSTVGLYLRNLAGQSRCHCLSRPLGCTVAALCQRCLGGKDGNLMLSLPRSQPQETSQECQGCRGSQTELPRRDTPPTLKIGDGASHQRRRDRLLLRRKASHKGVGAENVHSSREPLGRARSEERRVGKERQTEEWQ